MDTSTKWSLVLCSGAEPRSDLPYLIPLQPQPFVNILGREGGLLIDSRRYPLSVSRSHARIEGKNDMWTVTDLGSLNGTLVNGLRIEPHQPNRIDSGDIIVFGREVVPHSDVQYKLKKPSRTLPHKDTGRGVQSSYRTMSEHLTTMSAENASNNNRLRDDRRITYNREREQEIDEETVGEDRKENEIVGKGEGKGEDQRNVLAAAALKRTELAKNHLSINSVKSNSLVPSASLDGPTHRRPGWYGVIFNESFSQDSGPLEIDSPRSRDESPPMRYKRLDEDKETVNEQRKRIRGETDIIKEYERERLEYVKNKEKEEERRREELVCAICCDLCAAPTTLVPCGHMFCAECLRQLNLVNNALCPNCRTKSRDMVLSIPIGCLIEDSYFPIM
eukprot:Ihof_evm7s106 gene=Ihof_evmTU7s106